MGSCYCLQEVLVVVKRSQEASDWLVGSHNNEVKMERGRLWTTM